MAQHQNEHVAYKKNAELSQKQTQSDSDYNVGRAVGVERCVGGLRGCEVVLLYGSLTGCVIL